MALTLQERKERLERRIEAGRKAEADLALVERDLTREKKGIPVGLKIRQPTKQQRHWRERWTKPRLYVSIAQERGLEQLVFRQDRPVDTFKSYLPEMLAALDLPAETKARWSQNAGCSMCPCSPGFVLDLPASNVDYWVTLAGIPNELAKPVNERTVVRAGEALDLIASVS